MKKINNLEDLHKERLRLQLELIAAEEVLKEDIQWIKEETKSFNVVNKFFSKTFGNGTDGLLKSGVNLTIDAFVKNLLLSKSGWITRTIIPYILKGLSSGVLSNHKPEVMGFIKRAIQKARKSIQEDKQFYDKSTVDEMEY